MPIRIIRAAITPPDTTNPSVPGSPAVASTTTTTANLTWLVSTDNRSVKGYRLRRGGVEIGGLIGTLSYEDTGLTPGTLYNYEVQSEDQSGNKSAWSSVFSGTTQSGISGPAAVLKTEFAGLALEEQQSYPDGREYGFTGTDSVTTQNMSTTSPQVWGSQWGEPRIQALRNLSHGADGSTTANMWTFNFLTGLSGVDTAFEIIRNYDYEQADQAAYRIKPNNSSYTAQGMVYIRGDIWIPTTFPIDNDGFIGLCESKINGTNQKVELAATREGGIWYLKMGTYRFDGGGASSIWGTGNTLSVTCTPSPSSFFNDGAGQDILFSRGVFVSNGAGPAPGQGIWNTYEFAYRLQDANGNVAGSGSNGWIWAATSAGSSSAPATRGAGTQRFYVQGRNMHAAFAGSAPAANSIIFPFTHYTNFPGAGVGLRWANVEVYTDWPTDASTHPVGAV